MPIICNLLAMQHDYKGTSGDADAENTAATTVVADGSSTSTGGTERDIEQDLQQKTTPPGVNADGEMVDLAAYEAWAQASHQTREMTRREEVNINHAAGKEHDHDDGREIY